MPDNNSTNALYPQPVTPPSAAQNVFMGNPLDAAQKLVAIQGGQIANVGGQISNVTAQLEQNMKQTGFVSSVIGSLDKNSTPDDVNGAFTTIARNTNIPSPILQQLRSQVLNDPKGVAHGLQTLQSIALGGAGGAARVAAPPTAEGQPQQQPAGQSIFSGTNPTALSPSETAAGTAYGGAAGGQIAQDRMAATNYRREVFPLEQSIPALESLGTTGTGPGTETVNQIKSFLQSAGAGTVLGVDVSKIKDFDEAKKYLTDWVMATGSTGTNDKLAAAFASNANVGISNAAATDVAKSALSLRRMKQAQLMEFEKSGLPDSSYTKWASKWNIQQDPRAFGVDFMTPEAKQSLLSELNKPGNKAEKSRFVASLRAAHDNGLSSPRGGWNAPTK